MKKKDKGPNCFELKLANGKTRSFNSGYEMWQWGINNCKNMDTKYDERTGPFLSDFFDKLRKK